MFITENLAIPYNYRKHASQLCIGSLRADNFGSTKGTMLTSTIKQNLELAILKSPNNK